MFWEFSLCFFGKMILMKFQAMLPIVISCHHLQSWAFPESFQVDHGHSKAFLPDCLLELVSSHLIILNGNG
jgi:hypothetical protein